MNEAERDRQTPPYENGHSTGRRVYHVAKGGNDGAEGGEADPLVTIGEAAQRAMPGDTVVVHGGIYRESVHPVRGGLSDTRRITYCAADGEAVEIRGSEIVKGWTHEGRGIWRVALPNDSFDGFNPFEETIRGDWFNPQGLDHLVGSVYLNGKPLRNARYFHEIRDPLYRGTWSATVDAHETTLRGQFYDCDPNAAEVEIAVRRSAFYPSRPGIDYITVRGFTVQHTATPWAPPTAEQIGAIGTNWSQGWIIEHNTVRHSRCVGITLGKYGDEWDNTSADTAEGYVETVRRARDHGWDREHVGGHIVRHNTVSQCGQAGIVGSLGAIFSEISENVIHDIHRDTGFSGAEMAGIKLHGAVDTLIRGNRIYASSFGIWLDWMAQGTRVTGNLLHDNELDDLFVEVNHGPFVVDHNLFLSDASLRDWSQGGCYAHNLMGGRILQSPEHKRSTPYLQQHTTDIAGLDSIAGGDNRFVHNIVVDAEGLESYTRTARPCVVRDNVHIDRAPSVNTDEARVYLLGGEHALPTVPLLSTDTLGETAICGLPFEAHTGGPLALETDYFGATRTGESTIPGPFAHPIPGDERLPVWPIR